MRGLDQLHFAVVGHCRICPGCSSRTLSRLGGKCDLYRRGGDDRQFLIEHRNDDLSRSLISVKIGRGVGHNRITHSEEPTGLMSGDQCRRSTVVGAGWSSPGRESLATSYNVGDGYCWNQAIDGREFRILDDHRERSRGLKTSGIGSGVGHRSSSNIELLARLAI